MPPGVAKVKEWDFLCFDFKPKDPKEFDLKMSNGLEIISSYLIIKFLKCAQKFKISIRTHEFSQKSYSREILNIFAYVWLYDLISKFR